jgi:hypothetical protein
LGVVPTQPLILHLCRLGHGFKEDALILLLQVLASACKLDAQVTATMESALGPLLVQVWSDNRGDVFIMELVQDLFTILASNPGILIFDLPLGIVVAFQTRMFPLLLSVFQQENVESSESNLAATSLDLLTTLCKQVPGPLPLAYTQQAHPIVMKLLLEAEDAAILQNGQEFIRVLVARDFHGVVASRGLAVDGIGTYTNVGSSDPSISGLDLMLAFIGKMLDPQGNEGAAIFLGPLITKLIQQGGDVIAPILSQLLTAILNRLATASMPKFIETLVLVFCHLVDSHAATVIEFLAVANIGDRNGLQVDCLFSKLDCCECLV